LTGSHDVRVSRLRQILADPAAARATVVEEFRIDAAERIDARLDDLERRMIALEARMSEQEQD